MDDTTRRGFLTQAAAAAAGAGAVIVSQPALAAPTEAPDTSKASPALREAVIALTESHDSLMAAKKRFAEEDRKVSEWAEANPQPTKWRARKRWYRKWNEYRQTTTFPSWEKQLEAEIHFEKAQYAVAEFRPADMNDLALMAAASAVYDVTRVAGGQKAMIAFGVALGLFNVLTRA
jgi:hypothetical protein